MSQLNDREREFFSSTDSLDAPPVVGQSTPLDSSHRAPLPPELDVTPPEPSPPPAGRTSTFAALSVRRYRHLWYGGLFSFLAVQMQVIARGALAWDLTHSNSALGFVMFGFGLPMLLLTPMAGVAADRLPKRTVIILSQWLLAVSAFLVALALVFDVMAFWMLVASSVAQAASFAFLGPSRMAFTGELVGRKLLSNAVVLQQMSMNGTRVFGPAAAGMLIGVTWFGYAGVYFSTAALTLIASAFTYSLPPGNPPPNKEARKPMQDFADGLRYVRANPNLMLLLLVSLAVIVGAFPYISFLPTLAKDIYERGDTGYGFMSGATAIGAVLASLFIASRSGGPNAWRIQAFAGLMFGVGLIVLAVAPTFGLTLVILTVVGGSTSAFQSLNNTMVLMGSEMAYHGRMQSLMSLTFSGFGLMALPIGVVADAIGLRATFAIMGSFTSSVMVLYFFIRPRIERRYPMTSIVD